MRGPLTLSLVLSGALLPALGLAQGNAAAEVGQQEGQPADPTAVPLNTPEVLSRALAAVDTQLRDLESQLQRVRLSAMPPEEQAQKRLTDAQVLYTFRNYDAAATILYDVVDRYPNARAHGDALFYLADALFLRRDYLSARRYFSQFVGRYGSHTRYQEALLRLLECALHLSDYDQASASLQKLNEIPKERLLAAAPYVQGKYFYMIKQYDKSLAFLAPVIPQSTYYFQARYLVGAIHVSQGKLEEALSDFAQLVGAPQRTDEERRVVELGHLALGRIYYEQGQTQRAQEEYLLISQKSDLFVDALYESSWAAIKAKDYKRAQRNLELMVLASPDSLIAPEAKLLIGNLHIRLNEYEPATRWFQKTLEEFEPVSKKIDEAMAEAGDPVVYFRNAVAKNLAKFDLAQVVPKQALVYVKAEPQVVRFTGLAQDVSELTKSLEEAEETVRRVELALQGSKRYTVDADLAQVRMGGIRASANLGEARKGLLEILLRLTEGSLSAEDRAQVQELFKRRGELLQRFGRLMGILGQKGRVTQLQESINALDRQVAELAVHLEGLRKHRSAVEQYYADTGKDQKISREQFQKDLAKARADEEQAQREYEQLRKDLAVAMRAAEAEKDRIEAQGQIEADAAQVAQSERELVTRLQQQLRDKARSQVEVVASFYERIGALEKRAQTLSGDAGGRLETKVSELQSTLQLEKENLRRYREALAAAAGESQEVGGGVVALAMKGTQKRFYDIVVRADVGIIDVAWALKQQRTDKISQMVREQKRELKLLDDEFREVLKKD